MSNNYPKTFRIIATLRGPANATISDVREKLKGLVPTLKVTGIYDVTSPQKAKEEENNKDEK